jgi:hypothetical protein
VRIGFKDSRKARIEALCAGVRAAGDTPVHYWDGAGEAFGIAADWGAALELYRVGYKHVLVCECGYLGNRYLWSSLAWDGLNGRGIHAEGPLRAVPYLEPWRGAREGYALILGQVPTDWAVKLALKGLSYADWLEELVLELELRGYVPRYRPHPEIYMADATRTRSQLPLLEELAGARIAVTLNSTAAIDAVCAGVPTVVKDRRGCMAGAVSSEYGGRWLAEEPPHRRAWANKLARMQWSLDELSNGLAWSTLRRCVL